MLGTEAHACACVFVYKEKSRGELVTLAVAAGCPCPVEVPSDCCWDAVPSSSQEKARRWSPDPLNRFEGQNLPTARCIDSKALFLPGQIPALGKEQSVQVQTAFNCKMYLTMDAFRLDMIQVIQRPPDEDQ